MTWFWINWTDPDTGECLSTEREFHDTPAVGPSPTNGFGHGPISARQWAEDWAYSMADKGKHSVKEIKGREQ